MIILIDVPRGWLTCSRSHSLYVAVPRVLIWADKRQALSIIPGGHCFQPSCYFSFIAIRSRRPRTAENREREKEMRPGQWPVFSIFISRLMLSGLLEANTWLLTFSCKRSSQWLSESWRFRWGWQATSTLWASMSQRAGWAWWTLFSKEWDVFLYKHS